MDNPDALAETAFHKFWERYSEGEEHNARNGRYNQELKPFIKSLWMSIYHSSLRYRLIKESDK